MKITELLEDLGLNEEKMPHLYLDMDGVQADFFGAWANRHKVDHWKAVKDKEIEIDKLAHSSGEQVYDFFRNLEPLSSGKQIIDWLRQNNIPYTVLSAPLRGPHSKDSIRAKKDWLDVHHPGTSQDAIFTSEKYMHAMDGGRSNVLVDDYGPYIQKWVDAGGIGVKHEEEHKDPSTGDKTIAQLEKIYSKYLNK